jgi:hypothetical protein
MPRDHSEKILNDHFAVSRFELETYGAFDINLLADVRLVVALSSSSAA